MYVPDGFVEVIFEAFKNDEQVSATAFICTECQAVVLQGGILKGYGPSYADKHLAWHDKINRKLFDVETELTLIEGEWEERKKQ
jgi:hypothetical protein